MSSDKVELKQFTISRVTHCIERTNKELKAYEDKYPDPYNTLTYHGGWKVGYMEGKLSVLEDLLDDLKEET